MQEDILLKCVDCGYEAKTFNVVIHGSSRGAFTYVAQCPLCESKKVKYISGSEEPDLEIYITSENKIKLSSRKR